MATRPKHKHICPLLPPARAKAAPEGVDVDAAAALDVSLLPCDAVCDEAPAPVAVLELVIPPDSAVEVEVTSDSDVVSIGNPNSSVVAGGSVAMSGAGSVTSSIAALTVYAQKQVGVSVGT